LSLYYTLSFFLSLSVSFLSPFLSLQLSLLYFI
jgi:hypothetical protein